MKKVFKNKMLLIILLIVIGMYIGVGATTLYYSNQVSYKDSNVENALNDLYSIKTDLDDLKKLGDATADNISEGKTAIVNGELVTGNGNDIKNYYSENISDGILTRTVAGSSSNFSPNYVERSIFINIPIVEGYKYHSCAMIDSYAINSNSKLQKIKFRIEKYSDTQIRIYADKSNTNWSEGGVAATATAIIYYTKE